MGENSDNFSFAPSSFSVSPLLNSMPEPGRMRGQIGLRPLPVGQGRGVGRFDHPPRTPLLDRYSHVPQNIPPPPLYAASAIPHPALKTGVGMETTVWNGRKQKDPRGQSQ